mmetsp:Transcript_93884/g.223328  ORF Transcript_93884/g.223328 Transcript_93884/m.223328 type:complete len:212 (+) Transcript_93884:702-1337(+)
MPRTASGVGDPRAIGRMEKTGKGLQTGRRAAIPMEAQAESGTPPGPARRTGRPAMTRLPMEVVLKAMIKAATTRWTRHMTSTTRPTTSHTASRMTSRTTSTTNRTTSMTSTTRHMSSTTSTTMGANPPMRQGMMIDMAGVVATARTMTMAVAIDVTQSLATGTAEGMMIRRQMAEAEMPEVRGVPLSSPTCRAFTSTAETWKPPSALWGRL